MPQIALHTVLRPGCEQDYRDIHASIPADVASALTAHGVREWRIWVHGRHVFHLVDVDDYRAMRHGLRDHPANVAWQALVGPLHEVADDYSGGDDGVPLLWSLSDQLASMEGDSR
jgi:L-rhamnose mutarotase